MPGADGNLATVSGADVLSPSGQPIPIPNVGVGQGGQQLSNGKIQVDKQGNINIGGDVFGQIGVVEFNNLQSLQPQGATELRRSGNCRHTSGDTAPACCSTPKSAATPASSNRWRRLITNERWFEANEKSISTQDDATNQAISTVGRSTAS